MKRPDINSHLINDISVTKIEFIYSQCGLHAIRFGSFQTTPSFLLEGHIAVRQMQTIFSVRIFRLSTIIDLIDYDDISWAERVICHVSQCWKT